MPLGQNPRAKTKCTRICGNDAVCVYVYVYVYEYVYVYVYVYVYAARSD